MSAAKHSLGPWEAWLPGIGGKLAITGPSAAANGAGRDGVRNCSVCHDLPVIVIAASDRSAPALAFGDTEQAAIANARLIAAAPAMLEVLRRFIAASEESRGSIFPDDYEPELDAAHVAIAKATGASA